MSILRRHPNAAAIFLLVLLCYTYFFPRWADVSQNSRLNMVVAVVDDGSFEIGKYYKNTTDYAKIDGKYYSDKAPGISFLAIPLYYGLNLALKLPIIKSLTDRLERSEAFQSTLRATGSGVNEQKVKFALLLIISSFMLGALPTAVLCVLVYEFSKKVTEDEVASILTACSFGLLSHVFAYANMLYGHNLCGCILFGVFSILFNLDPAFAAPTHQPSKPISKLALFGVGLLLGLSVITEYTTALVVIVLFVYATWVLWKRKQLPQLFWVALGGAIFVGVLMAYNAMLWHNPFETGYKYSELWQAEHSTGFMSITFPHITAIWGITFGIFRGLFVLAPVMLLPLAGFVIWFRQRRFRAAFWVCVASILAYFTFNSSSVMWSGGFTIGPRYLVPAMSFYAVGMGFALRIIFARSTSKAWQALWLIASLWSLIGIWGMTLANQSYPPDYLPNPYMQWALPAWQTGNIARNIGTLLGFKGISSLIPLIALVAVLVAVWVRGALHVRKTSSIDIIGNSHEGHEDARILRETS